MQQHTRYDDDSSSSEVLLAARSGDGSGSGSGRKRRLQRQQPRRAATTTTAIVIVSMLLLLLSSSTGSILFVSGLSDRVLRHPKFRRVKANSVSGQQAAQHEYIVVEQQPTLNDEIGAAMGSATNDNDSGDSEQTTARLCKMAERANCACTVSLTVVFQGFALRCDDEKVLHELLEEQSVQSVQEAPMMYVSDTAGNGGPSGASSTTNVDDGVQMSAPWGLDRIDQKDLPLNFVYHYGENTGEGVDVYIFDTGIMSHHKEFAGGRVECVYDHFFPSNAATGTDGAVGRCQDGHGHGTHVAGIVGGGYFTGVAKKVNLKTVKVLKSGGSGSVVGIVAAIEYVIQHAKGTGRPSIINFSLGGAESSALDTAVEKASQNNILVVAASGNTNDNACNHSPSGEKSALVVAASNMTDGRVVFSSFGPCVDIYAPGQDILSSVLSSTPNGTYATWSGSSMAAPHVAGLAALYWQRDNGLTQQQIQDAIIADALLGKIKSNKPNTANKLANIVQLLPEANEPEPDISASPSAAPTPDICRDVPGWRDKYGDDCDWYAEKQPAGCPQYYHEEAGNFGIFGNMTAGEACCHCGGGTVPPGQCINKAGWQEIDTEQSYGCDWYEKHQELGCPGSKNTKGTSGRTAGDACCHCGGGTTRPHGSPLGGGNNNGGGSVAEIDDEEITDGAPIGSPTTRITPQPAPSPTIQQHRPLPQHHRICEQCKHIVFRSVFHPIPLSSSPSSSPSSSSPAGTSGYGGGRPSPFALTTSTTTIATTSSATTGANVISEQHACAVTCRATVKEKRRANVLSHAAGRKIRLQCGNLCRTATNPNKPLKPAGSCYDAGLC